MLSDGSLPGHRGVFLKVTSLREGFESFIVQFIRLSNQFADKRSLLGSFCNGRKAGAPIDLLGSGQDFVI